MVIHPKREEVSMRPMIFVLSLLLTFFFGIVRSCWAKSVYQTVTGDQVCAQTEAIKETCKFDLATIAQPLRVSYPASGKSTRFILEGAKVGDKVKLELIPAEGYGLSVVIATKGKEPLLVWNEMGDAVRRPSQRFLPQKWNELPAVALFFPGTDTISPVVQKTMKGQYFMTLQIIAVPLNGRIEVFLTSEPYP